MINSNPSKVLLYSDGSHHSFSAAVYTANLLKSIPKIHLTVLQVQEKFEGSMDGDYILMDTRPSDPRLDWVKRLMNEDDSDKKMRYSQILAKTEEIFTVRGHNVNEQVIYSKLNITDLAKAIISYAVNNNFELIIMGTRGLTSLKGLIYGSLAHTVLNKSTIPVLLIKKLPQNFIDSYADS